MSEHWLDRLAERRTRAQVLKGVFAGAAMTLPFAGASPARAASRAECDIGTDASPDTILAAYGRGCMLAADQKYAKAFGACTRNLGATDAGVVLFVPLFGFASAAAQTVAAFALAEACAEGAVLVRNATKWQCTQQGFGGYSPCQAGGPCDTCFSPNVCCPDLKVVSGFSCCTAPPAGCCKSDGCHSGTTECSA